MRVRERVKTLVVVMATAAALQTCLAYAICTHERAVQVVCPWIRHASRDCDGTDAVQCKAGSRLRYSGFNYFEEQSWNHPTFTQVQLDPEDLAYCYGYWECAWDNEMGCSVNYGASHDVTEPPYATFWCEPQSE